MEESNAAVIELYGTYPDQKRAEEILLSGAKAEEFTDLCFVWNGGMTDLQNPEYVRQTQVAVTGVLGRHPCTTGRAWPWMRTTRKAAL